MRILCALLSLVLLTTLAAQAQTTVEAKVTYVSAGQIYLDAGREQGLRQGDSGEIHRDGALIVRLEVAFIADRSAACRVLEGTGEIRIGDLAVMTVQVLPAAPDTVQGAQAAPELPEPEAAAPSRARTPRVNRLTGHIGIQTIAQDGDNAFDDYVQPSLALRARVENLAGTRHMLNVRLRSRRSYFGESTGDRREWSNRVYEAALSYDVPDSRFGYAVGRILSNRMAGLGYIDGARLDYKTGSRVTLGAFGGTQPDLRTSNFRTETRKFGAYAAYQPPQSGVRRLSSTIALAGEYHEGEISREFLYEQLTYSAGSALSLYQSAELGIYRGWRKDAEGSSLALSNLLLNARYAPQRRITLSAGFDSRTPYRTWETRTLADSLFDQSLQQGYRLGVELRLPYALRADARGTMRTRESESTRSRTLALGLSTNNLLGQRITLGGQFNRYTNRFTHGSQVFVHASRALMAAWTAGVQVGQDRYDLDLSERSQSSRWVKLNSDWTLTRHLYGAGYYELYRGEPFEGKRWFMELGWRF